jgi:DNA repair ATPase RecN
MLVALSIKNYALIEHLEVDFSNQFSIITGETGAGKSILLGALGLVLGNRADLSSLKDNEQKCVIEAQFQLFNYNLQNIFETLDLDYDDATIIRREILPSGKSRAFVNDSPVTLQQLQELAVFLIDIHSQNETRALINESYQIDILDLVAQNESLIKDYQTTLKHYKSTQKQLNQLISDKETLLKEQEYHRFLLEELLQANLISGEQELLEEELEKLSNVEFIKENLDKGYEQAKIDCNSKPKFYGYYSDYDWVVFCWLFGKMIDLPEGFPKYCIDLKQKFDRVDNYYTSLREKDYQLMILEKAGKTIKSIKELPDYPKQTNEHNALADARWNKELYQFLNKL